MQQFVTGYAKIDATIASPYIYSAPIGGHVITKLSSSIGLGIDVGIADFLKVSPIIETRYSNPGIGWLQSPSSFFLLPNDGAVPLPTFPLPENISTHAVTYLLGLRMEINFKP